MNRFDPTSDNTSEWAENRRQINARTREFKLVLSEIARLMQRVIIKGNEAQRSELKSIFEDTKKRMLELVNKIDKY
jgi:hypothetical protein